jgi:hypothetical protein
MNLMKKSSMFEPSLKEVKRIFIKHEEKEESPRLTPIYLPDGRQFIGSGEDAHEFQSCTESC